MQLDFAVPSIRLDVLRTGAILVPDAPAIFQVEGSGALTCLQGLLTNDLEAPGQSSLVYGAMLSPKGMILFDAWVIRLADRLILVIPTDARDTALQLFRRSLPPRLATVTDLTDSHRAAWLLGGTASERLARVLGGEVPGPGKALSTPAGVLLAGGSEAAWFRTLVVASVTERDAIRDGFQKKGGTVGGEIELSAARVMAGWPTLGREIDERTLPQEVRFDEIGGVSYTKGCYTGQETVARVHFRGHVNRTLRGVEIHGAEPLLDRTLAAAGKQVGRVSSALVLEDRTLALALVRREIESGAVLRVSDRAATIVPLPLGSGS